jgi:topoisomerase-4 subunit A
MARIKAEIEEIDRDLANLVEVTASWFQFLKDKYGKEHPRLTEIRNFDTIEATKVAEANQKLYINRTDGFIGMGLKKDEFVCNCSDIDDIIIFYKDGKYKVIRVADKVFVGKNILHVAVFKKNDSRTTYNLVYREGKKGWYFMKRFNVTGISRDKEYDLTMGTPGSKVIYFTANPNGEAEVIRIQLKPALHLKKIDVIKDLSELAVKSRSARGNVLTKYEIKSISLKQKGHSTLGGRKVWFDPDVLRVNYDEQGIYLGEFKEEDRILVIRNDGNYYLSTFDLTAHFDTDIFRIEKYNKDKAWSLAMWNAEQKYYYAKRFYLDAQSKTQNLLGTDSNNKIVILTDIENPIFEAKTTDNNKPSIEIIMNDFIEIKSVKAKGKRITTLEVTEISDITPEPIIEETAEVLSEEIPNEMPVDVPLIIENNIPEDSLPIDEQLSLF